MTEDFICRRCGSEVLGKVYLDYNYYCVVEEHYECGCGFKWDWAYGYHSSESTIFEEKNISKTKSCLSFSDVISRG